MLPTRYTNLAEARKRFDSRVDKLAPYYFRADPLADAVAMAKSRMPAGKCLKLLNQALAEGIGKVQGAPKELRDLFAHVEDVPFWLDWDAVNLGGATLRRCGLTGGLLLACCALPLSYSSPAGNKPLMFSGNLIQRADRRLSESARFVGESCLPGGLKPYAPGWKVTVKVRLMHAQMRRLVRQSPRWNLNAWGMPLNQVDMAGGCLLFSVALLDFLRGIGFHFSRAEGDAVMQLWRYSGYLLGIEPELLCATEAEGRNFLELLKCTQEGPDKDSQELTRALMETGLPEFVLPQHPERARNRLTRFCYGLSHALLGKDYSEQLGYPQTWWRHIASSLLWLMIKPFETCRRIVPGVHSLAVALGTSNIRRRMTASRAASQAPFQMPKTLGNPEHWP